MDPPLPLSVRPLSQTTILPQIPNPNSEPLTPSSDLPTTISLLKDIVSIAKSTLKSVSDFFSPPSSPGFCRCPFDPHHQMPPESLFRHSLLCPSAPGSRISDLGFLDNLRYQTSLKSEAQLQQDNRFFRPLDDSDTDLCFSLDAELEHVGSNFFYRDCPGVVTTPEPDVARTFTLPGILSAECSNFRSDGEGGSCTSGRGTIKILPSDFWLLECEAERWSDYPASYSYTVLRAASCLPGVEEGSLKNWVISNSPYHGIVIDVAMRDHIYLLLNLCLKVIRKEAHCSLEQHLSKDGLFNPRSLCFECPRLIGSLTWLASRLSVLYGEANSKIFTIRMFKEALLRVGSSLMLIRLRQDKIGEDGSSCSLGGVATDAMFESTKSNSIQNMGFEKRPEGSSSGQVFVSQIAAAVAALHERFLLEERIKMLRFAQPPSKSQLLNEYLYASTRGCEERGKHPDYRAVVEYDGLHWQRIQNQGQGKSKTIEELLAEERDYKRRRMSYRGKKVKRTPKEVIRYIIEEHMEEIKQAGGIGYDLKGLPRECNSHSKINADTRELRNSKFDASERRSNSSSYRKSLLAEYAVTSRKHEDVSGSDRSSKSHEWQDSHHKPRQEKSEYFEDLNRENENEKKYESRSSSSYKSYSLSRERQTHQKDTSDVEARKSKYKRTRSRSKDYISRSTLTSMSAEEEHDFKSHRDREQSFYSYRSDSGTLNGFEDRYDPSGSYDGHGTMYDVSVGSNFIRSDKFHNPNDIMDHNERQRNDSTVGRHHRSCHHMS